MGSSPPGAGGGKSFCNRCHRPVQMIAVDGKLTAFETEVISIALSNQSGGAVPVKSLVTGRRAHGALCENYVNEKRREEQRREMAEYNRRNKRGSL
jgi:hypothetical protein